MTDTHALWTTHIYGFIWDVMSQQIHVNNNMARVKIDYEPV